MKSQNKKTYTDILLENYLINNKYDFIYEPFIPGNNGLRIPDYLLKKNNKKNSCRVQGDFKN